MHESSQRAVKRMHAYMYLDRESFNDDRRFSVVFAVVFLLPIVTNELLKHLLNN